MKPINAKDIILTYYTCITDFSFEDIKQMNHKINTLGQVNFSPSTTAAGVVYLYAKNVKCKKPLSVFHTIIHNQHNQAQSCTIAQSHNHNTNFRTITQSKFKFCKFYYVMITIIHNHKQSHTINL